MDERRKLSGFYKPRKTLDTSESDSRVQADKFARLLNAIKGKQKSSHKNKSSHKKHLNKGHEILNKPTTSSHIHIPPTFENTISEEPYNLIKLSNPQVVSEVMNHPISEQNSINSLDKPGELIETPNVANGNDANSPRSESISNSSKNEIKEYDCTLFPETANEDTETPLILSSSGSNPSTEELCDVSEPTEATHATEHTEDATNKSQQVSRFNESKNIVSITPLPKNHLTSEPSELIKETEISKDDQMRTFKTKFETEYNYSNEPYEIIETAKVANGVNSPQTSSTTNSSEQDYNLSLIDEQPEATNKVKQLEINKNLLNDNQRVMAPPAEFNSLHLATENFYKAKTAKINQELQAQCSKDLYSSLFNQATRVCIAASMICISLAISYRTVGFVNKLCEDIQSELTRKACEIASFGVGCLLSGVGFFGVGKAMRLIDKKLFSEAQSQQEENAIIIPNQF